MAPTRKAKSKAGKPKRSTAEKHITALDKHTKALKEHSKITIAATSAQEVMMTALKDNTAALIAAKPRKSLGQKTTDAQMCMSQWLMRAKRVSQADSMDPTKNMAADFRVTGPPEMSLCLEWVERCLSGKGDIYTPKAASAAKLCTKTLGEVVASIASQIR